MTVIKFLSSYAQLFLNRAAAERIPNIAALYNEDVDGNAYVHIGNQHGGLDIIVGFGLTMEMNDEYTPVLTDAQWALFKENIQEPEPELVNCSGAYCEQYGEPNYGIDEYYCGGSPRCCP